METVQSVQFGSWWSLGWSFGVTWMVFRRWWCQPLGDIRIAIGDKVCQEFSSNGFVRRNPSVQQQMSSAVQWTGTPLWGWSIGPSCYQRRTKHLTLQTKHVPQKLLVLVLLCVSSTCLTTSQHHTNQHKPQESRNGQSYRNKFRCSHQNMIHSLRHNDKSLFAETGAGRPLNFSPPKEETNGEEVRQMHSSSP